jgi:hypothetical protein
MSEENKTPVRRTWDVINQRNPDLLDRYRFLQTDFRFRQRVE